MTPTHLGRRSPPAGTAAPTLALSVVVPVSERPEPLDELYREFADVLRRRGWDFEFLFVLEPWGGSLAERLQPLVDAGEPVTVLIGGQTMGEAALLKLAAGYCRGAVVVTLPPYYRVEANAVIGLVERVEEGVDLAVARRWPRHDSWLNRLQNRVFHALLATSVRGRRFRDVACGVRAMRRDVLAELPLYGEFFRFLPVLAQHEGFVVEERDYPQDRRDRPRRLHGPGVYFRRLIDLLGVFFLLRFTQKPLRFFGLMGGTLTAFGGTILVVLFVQRLQGQGMANRPLLLLGVLLVVLGLQAIALGLVGEIIVHVHAATRPGYRLRPSGPPDRDAEAPLERVRAVPESLPSPDPRT